MERLQHCFGESSSQGADSVYRLHLEEDIQGTDSAMEWSTISHSIIIIHLGFLNPTAIGRGPGIGVASVWPARTRDCFSTNYMSWNSWRNNWALWMTLILSYTLKHMLSHCWERYHLQVGILLILLQWNNVTLDSQALVFQLLSRTFPRWNIVKIMTRSYTINPIISANTDIVSSTPLRTYPRWKQSVCS